MTPYSVTRFFNSFSLDELAFIYIIIFQTMFESVKWLAVFLPVINYSTRRDQGVSLLDFDNTPLT